jgi:hypothetical protein
MLTSLAFLLSAAVVFAQSPTPSIPNPPTFPACFFTFELTRDGASGTPASSFEGGSVTVDSNQARTDALSRLGPTSQAIYTTIQTSTSMTLVTDYLNGTASCVVSTGMFDPVPALPNLTFVGTSTWAGSAVNHWSGKINQNADTFDYFTMSSDNDLPVMLTVSGSGFSATFLFKHTSRCQAGSVDPAFFAPPAGLKCKPIPFASMPAAPMSSIMKL